MSSGFERGSNLAGGGGFEERGFANRSGFNRGGFGQGQDRGFERGGFGQDRGFDNSSDNAMFENKSNDDIDDSNQ